MWYLCQETPDRINNENDLVVQFMSRVRSDYQLYCHSKPDKTLDIFHGSEAPSKVIDLGSLFCTEINAP